LQEPPPATVYWPALYAGRYKPGTTEVDRSVTMAIRTQRAGTPALIEQMGQAIWAVNPNLPLASVHTMGDLYDTSLARTSFTLVMLAIAGAMALLLGIVGIYGVISYAVSQRRREIGIRMALGAQQRGVERMFVRDGLVLAAAGSLIGLGAAALLTRLMSSLLFGVGALDPITYAAVPVILALAAAAASYIPARRAAAIDPVEALKAD